jgi:erythritol kinase
MIGLSIDIGTSVVKVAAFHPEGRLVATARSDAPVLRPKPAFSEYDPQTVWAAVCAAVGNITARYGRDVDRISVTGQGDGCWLIADDGSPVGNAILWNDGRAGEIISDWERNGSAEKVYAHNGSALFTGAQAAILRWLSDHEPERLRRAASVLFCTGWLTHRLTGVLAADRSDASLPWLEIRTRAYSQEILDILDMRWVEHLRPPLCDDLSVIGALTSRAADDLGLRPGIPVTHAPFDCVAMALGAGVISPGDTLVVLGTTLIVESVISEVDTTGPARGMTLCTGLPDTWLRLFGTLSGTDSLNWMTSVLGVGSAASYLDEAESAPPGAHGLRILPYFSPAGERAPFLDPTARAAVVGLSLDHDRADIARAHLEGLTFALRHCVEQMPSPSKELVVCGGGAASRFWCTLIADVTGVPTRSLPDAELGTLGADVVARAALSGTAVKTLAARSDLDASSFEPDPSTRSFYDDAYSQFHTLRDHARPTWHELRTG